MPRIKTVQTSLVTGEVSPRAFGRTDIEQYFSGAEELKNVYVTTQGGVRRREGLQYVATTNGSNVSRLVPFEFNDEQVFLFVFQPSHLQIYKNDVLQQTITTGRVTDLTDTIIAEMNWTQSADTMIIVHKDLKPIKITRVTDTNWDVVDVVFDFIPQHAFSGTTQTDKTTTLSFATQPEANTRKLTSVGEFPGSVVGQQVIANSGVFQIIDRLDNDNVIARVLVEPANFNNTTEWILETGFSKVWSLTHGWPAAATFFQGRLWLAGGSRPQTLWGSAVGKFFDFELRKQDASDAIDVTIDDDRVNAIRNIFAGRNLSIFTSGGEFFVKGGALSEPLTPDNIEIKRATLHGSERTRPVSVDGTILFVERGGSVIREFVFSDLEDTFTANDISRLAEHLVKSPTRMTTRNSTTALPTPYVYMVSDDGKMTVVAISRQEKILAFTEFNTDGLFEDVVTVDKEVYVIVNRDGDRFIEKFNSAHVYDASIRLDNGTPKTTWSGFDHLEGREVRVRADNFIFQPATVSGGDIETEEATVLEAGLNFKARFKSLPLDGQSGEGVMTGSYKRLVSVNIRLDESRQIIVERVKSNGVVKQFKPPFRTFGSNVLDDPIQNFSGWKKVFIGGVDRDIQVTITQDEGFEFNILSLVYEFGT